MTVAAAGRVGGLLVHDEVAVEGALVHGELLGVAVGAGLESRLLPPALRLGGGVLAGLEADVAGGAVYARVHRPVPVVRVDLKAAQLAVHLHRAQTALRVTGEAAFVLRRLGERVLGQHGPGGERRQGDGSCEGEQAAAAHGALTPSSSWHCRHIERGWQTRQESLPLAAISP